MHLWKNAAHVIPRTRDRDRWLALGSPACAVQEFDPRGFGSLIEAESLLGELRGLADDGKVDGRVDRIVHEIGHQELRRQRYDFDDLSV
jgi:hypothetical protein